MTGLPLRTSGLTVRYGGVRALTDVNVTVHEGELLGLIGPNGAGKTTFIDAVTGFASSRGTVEVAGTRVDGLSPDARARRGLGRTWQAAELFEDLNVADNLVVGRPTPGRLPALRGVLTGRCPAHQANETLERLGIGHLATALPTSLSQGQRKLVGVARALMARPAVLLLDEPAAGLDVEESADFGARMRRLVDEGLSAILVDHDMSLVMSTCDRLVVLEFGLLIADGPPDAVRADPHVIEAYLGSSGQVTA